MFSFLFLYKHNIPTLYLVYRPVANFLDYNNHTTLCANPGPEFLIGRGGEVQARRPENSLDNVFSPHFISLV